MSKLNDLINQKPCNFLDIIYALEKPEDITCQDSLGKTVFEILVDTAFSEEPPQPLHLAWLRRLLNQERYKSSLAPNLLYYKYTNLDALLYKHINQEKINLSQILFLVRAGASPHITNFSGIPLFHYVALHKNFQSEAIKELVLTYGIAVDTPRPDGKTCLQLLIEQHPLNLQAITALAELNNTVQNSAALPFIAKNSDPNAIRAGRPLLHLYIFPDCNYKAVLELKRRGADINIKHNGKTAIELLLDEKKPKFNTIMKLIELGGDCNSKNSQGDSLLHILVQNYIFSRNPLHNQMIKQLVTQYHANLEIKNKANETPLQSIINNPHTLRGDVMNLVRLGANPRDPRLLYHLASPSASDVPLIKELVTKYRVDINTKHRNKTIIDIELAKSPRHIAVIQRYIELGANKKWREVVKILAKRDTCLTPQEIDLMDKEQLRSNGFLYQLLIGESANFFCTRFYDRIKNYKEAILQHIKTLNAKEKAHALLDALDINTALGHLMWLKRGWFATYMGAGNLKECHLAMMQNLRANKPLLENPKLLLRLLNFKALPETSTKKITTLLSRSAVLKLHNHIQDKLTKEQRTMALLNPHIRLIFKKHLGIVINNAYINQELDRKASAKPVQRFAQKSARPVSEETDGTELKSLPTAPVAHKQQPLPVKIITPVPYTSEKLPTIPSPTPRALPEVQSFPSNIPGSYQFLSALFENKKPLPLGANTVTTSITQTTPTTSIEETPVETCNGNLIAFDGEPTAMQVSTAPIPSSLLDDSFPAVSTEPLLIPETPKPVAKRKTPARIPVAIAVDGSGFLMMPKPG